MNDDLDLDRYRRSLAPLDVDEATARRMRDRAQAELLRAGRPRRLRRAWRAAELYLAAAMGVVYLGWALERVTSLYR